MTVVLLLSHERSGSHMLADFIGKAEAVCVFDEVCNVKLPYDAGHDFGFHEFAAAFGREAAGRFQPADEEYTEALVCAYIGHLQDLAGRPAILLDIKYAHLGAFDHYWRPPSGPPFMLELARRHGWKVIHLYRQSVVHAVVSAFYAEQRGIWHEEAGEAGRERPAFALPVESAVRLIETFRNDIALVKRWLSGVPHLELSYERIATDLVASAAFRDSICDWLGVPPAGAYQPRYRKTTPPLREVVSNLDELLSRLATP